MNRMCAEWSGGDTVTVFTNARTGLPEKLPELPSHLQWDFVASPGDGDQVQYRAIWRDLFETA